MTRIQNWQKIDFLIEPRSDIHWMSFGLGACFVDKLSEEKVRLYVGGRSPGNISKIGIIDLEILNDKIRILQISSNPVLETGLRGDFDDNGVSYPWLIKEEHRYFLYYTGWTLDKEFGFRNHLGLAISNDEGKTFNRYSNKTLFENTDDEPFGTGSVAVLKHSQEWLMYYTCFKSWIKYQDKMQPVYNIKLARSDNGINWQRDNTTCIDFSSPREHVIAKPMLFRLSKTIQGMYYCYRSLGSNYRIGYAESHNESAWQRMDHLVRLEPGPSAWDSEMLEYAFVFELQGRRYMAYNGNGYGKSGIGFAVLLQ